MKRSYLMLFLAATIVSCCSTPGLPGSSPVTSIEGSDPHPFDSIITRELLLDAFDRSIRGTFDVTKEGNSRVYSFLVQLETKDPSVYCVASAGVAPSGEFIRKQEYLQRRQSFEREYADRGSAYLRSEFPDIGRRAQSEFWGAGPGGSSFGLTFTTSDGKYDVRLTVSELLREGLVSPGFDPKAAARRISRLYDKAVEGGR